MTTESSSADAPALQTPPATPPTFDAMRLSEPMRRALADVGYVHPTDVQAATFEAVSAGRDVIVQSRTGSGKTAAFAIPLLDRVIQPEKKLQAMVLCPTRELALQVAGEFERLGKHGGLRTSAVYGGASMTKQIAELEAGAQVVCGTPGRVLDHLRRKTMDPSSIRAVVLDEADEMLSMGFAEELNAILEFLPKKRQTLLFSATMPEPIQRMAKRHQREPEFITLSSDNVAPTDITHEVYFVSSGNRAAELVRIIELEKPDGALIFCNTKDETEAVATYLVRHGLSADWLNGDLAQADREKVMEGLRRGTLKFVVATDVAARGIDVSHLSHVINYGFPDSPESYVHRTGRTGRAGRAGRAISLITPHDIGALYYLRLTYGIRPIERALPSAGEERARREFDRLRVLVEAFPGQPADEARSLARRLLTHDDAERIVASLVGEFFSMTARQAIEQPAARPAPSPAERIAGATEPRSATPQPEARAPEAPRPPRREEGPRRREERRGDERREDRRGEERREERRGDERRGEARGAGPSRAPSSPSQPAPQRRAEVPGEVSPDDLDAEQGMEELKLAVGRRDNVRAGDIARVLRECGLSRRDVGRIHVRDRFTLASVRAEVLDRTIEALKDAQLNDRPLAPERGTGGRTAASEGESSAEG